MKNKVRLCCFSVNFTHACIIVNNFITNELENVKIIYINEKNEEKKLKSIISKFYPNLESKILYTDYLNENIINNYECEKFAFVVKGKEKFIENVNKYLLLNEFEGYIINCYDIFECSKKINSIISMHDYFLNTEGIILKEKI